MEIIIRETDDEDEETISPETEELITGSAAQAAPALEEGEEGELADLEDFNLDDVPDLDDISLDDDFGDEGEDDGFGPDENE